jgi:hypothetical protein
MSDNLAKPGLLKAIAVSAVASVALSIASAHAADNGDLLMDGKFALHNVTCANALRSVASNPNDPIEEGYALYVQGGVYAHLLVIGHAATLNGEGDVKINVNADAILPAWRALCRKHPDWVQSQVVKTIVDQIHQDNESYFLRDRAHSIPVPKANSAEHGAGDAKNWQRM